MDGVLRLSFKFRELMYESPRVAEDALVWEGLAREALEAETGRADWGSRRSSREKIEKSSPFH